MKEFLAFIWEQLKPHRKTVLFCLGLAIVAAMCDLAAPVLMGRGFDAANHHAVFLLYGGAIIGWFAVRTLAQVIRNRIGSIGSQITERINQRFDSDAVARLLRKPMTFHVSQRGHEVSQKVNNAAMDMLNFISNAVFDFIPNILSLLVAAIYLATLDLRVMAVFVTTIVTYALVIRKQIPTHIKLRRERNRASREASQFGWNAVANSLIVKSMGGEERTATGLRGYAEGIFKAVGAFQRFNEKRNNAQSLILGTGQLVILLLSVSSFQAGRFSFGTLTAITSYTFAMFGSLEYFRYVFRLVIESVPSFRDAREILEMPDEDYTSGHAVDVRGGVEFRNVRFRYREERTALEDVNFTVKPGERVAIVGESGEGKTTLVDLLGRYYLPQSGEILMDGTPSREINLASLRAQMAYVPQDLSLFHESLKYNIAYGRPNATEADVKHAAKLAHLEEFIEKLPEGWDTVVGERGLKLSGGERQRVALARAFLRDPKILILDEPTSNLDSKTEAIIQDSLAELMKGRTTFVIAHRLKTVMHADRILVLKDGRIVEQGTHDELAKNGASYAALLKAQGTFVADAAA